MDLRRATLLTIVAATLTCAGCSSPNSTVSTLEREESNQRAQMLGGAAREARIAALDYGFDPAAIEGQPGERLKIVLENRANHDHSLVLDTPGEPVRLKRILRPGETGEVEFTLPEDQPVVNFHCPIANHDSRGMQGRIILR